MAPSPKSNGQALAADVIRYWRALLSYQEALAVRPRARRPQSPLLGATAGAVNLAEPTPGQDYAKLPFAGAESFLVNRSAEVRVDLSAEWCAFLENWLSVRYRRGDDDESALSHLVFFPTLHLPRDELAGLLRFPIDLEWRGSDDVFKVPVYSQRRRSLWPAPPTHAVLRSSAEPSDTTLPFFIDTKVLHETLRIDGERIDDFFGALRNVKSLTPRATIDALLELIRGQEACDAGRKAPQETSGEARGSERPDDPRARLSLLRSVIADRLVRIDSRTRVYGIAIVVSGETSRATWHLQRDLRAVLEQLEGPGLDRTSSLSAYLGGTPQACVRSTCWGRWRGAPLTKSQSEAGEIALGSALSAIQGPPGTGKTTLILNLLAHALVCKVTALARTERMGRGITVVTSTNNRAVDNVVDPLGRDFDRGRLPLSLRVGSRQVLEKVTLVDLLRVRRYLEANPLADGEARKVLTEELRCFRALRTQIETQIEPERAYRELVERRQAVEADLRDLRAEVAESTSSEPIRDAIRKVASANSSGATLVALESLSKRLLALSELAEGEGATRLAQIRKHWKRTKQRQLSTVRQALGFELSLPLPPSPEPNSVAQALEAWEEGAESALDVVRSASLALTGEKKLREACAKIASHEKELESLRSKTAVAPDPDPERQRSLDGLHRELFECAVRVREAWACVHRSDLIAAVDSAVKAIQSSRSLRSLMEAEREPSRWLRELFPAWGCTLLSLGNVFPGEPGCIDIAVVDEAGQCHPAYAIGALLRAKSSLMIGDVHQLEPVVGLTVDDERRVLRGFERKTEDGQLDPYRAYDGSGTSAQALADRSVQTRPTLIDHFRCQAPIIAICEALCGYGLVAHTPARTRGDIAPCLRAPVLHLSVIGTQERFAGSYWNEAEARATMDLVRELLQAGIAPAEIGIVTPYRGQLERLWRGLREARVPIERPSTEIAESDDIPLLGGRDAGIAIGTVHRFQGGERSIILFTTTATNERSLAFLDARVNLVNVAASRAREHLITIGHSATLAAGRCTRHLVEQAVRMDRSALLE